MRAFPPTGDLDLRPTDKVRQPQARVLRNSTRLLDSGIQLLALEGQHSLTFRKVASRAGLSPQPLRDRYADVPALTAGLWEERAWPVLREHLLVTLEAAGMLDAFPSETHLTESLTRLARPDDDLLAAGELLVGSHFEPVLKGSVVGTIGHQIQAWCSPRIGRVSPAVAARRAYLLCLALGLVLAGRREGAEDHDLSGESAALLSAFASDREPSELPNDQATHLREGIPLTSGDPLLDALLDATLKQVGRIGYEAATTQRIVSSVGVTEGALFSRYKTKLELFIDATERQLAFTYGLNEQWTRDLTERYGQGIAEAVTLREFQRPTHQALRALNLEQLRVTWRDPVLRHAHEVKLREFESVAYSDDRARFHALFAHGLGSNLLPHLYEDCWKLPYDVVTVPLLEPSND